MVLATGNESLDLRLGGCLRQTTGLVVAVTNIFLPTRYVTLWNYFFGCSIIRFLFWLDMLIFSSVMFN